MKFNREKYVLSNMYIYRITEDIIGNVFKKEIE